MSLQTFSSKNYAQGQKRNEEARGERGEETVFMPCFLTLSRIIHVLKHYFHNKLLTTRLVYSILWVILHIQPVYWGINSRPSNTDPRYIYLGLNSGKVMISSLMRNAYSCSKAFWYNWMKRILEDQDYLINISISMHCRWMYTFLRLVEYYNNQLQAGYTLYVQ
jgi:hypothetical protein